MITLHHHHRHISTGFPPLPPYFFFYTTPPPAPLHFLRYTTTTKFLLTVFPPLPPQPHVFFYIHQRHHISFFSAPLQQSLQFYCFLSCAKKGKPVLSVLDSRGKEAMSINYHKQNKHNFHERRQGGQLGLRAVD